MQAAFLVFLLGWGVADFLYTREIRFASMALFYAALSFQAQYAAARFAARGFRALELPAEPSRGEPSGDKQDEFKEDPIRVRPFAKDRAPHYEGYRTAGSRPGGSQGASPGQQSEGARMHELPPPHRPSEPRPKAAASASAAAAAAAAASAATTAPAKGPRRPLGSSTPGFARAPKFSGRAHEILAVAENAATRTILSAFRHWIKRYHPDHAPEAAAGEKARLLTQARNTLLEKRKRQARAA